MEVSTSLNLGADSKYADITNAITAGFQHTVQDVYCDECFQNQDKYRSCEIVAAPKILHVQIAILQIDGKIMHSMTYPEILDLTPFQQFTALPLQYRLSGVISHSGESANFGHYIASVRGRNPDEFMCISDDDREDFSLAEILANPQHPQVEQISHEDGYQVYMLSYIRDDTNRQMPPRPSKGGKRTGRGRLTRELKNLMS